MAAEPRSASADALLTEHFRHTPLSLLDDIINTVNAILYRAVNAVESGLLNTPAPSLGFSGASEEAEEARRVEVEDGVHRLETLLSAAADRNFDKLEIYALRNILTVGDGLEKWMVLEHYKNIQTPLPPSAATPQSIETLRQDLHSAQETSLRLEAEEQATSDLLTQLQSLTRPNQSQPDSSKPTPSLAFLANDDTTGNLTTSAQFAASQLPALRSLLAALRPELPSLREDVVRERVRQGADLKSDRDKRKAYVDGEAERAVRGAVGVVEKGADGEGLGVKVGEGEVKALEEVVREMERSRDKDKMEE